MAATSPRVWGRQYNSNGTYSWVIVTPDANGTQTAINLTWLVQVLNLVKGESPIYSTVGIADFQDVMNQIQPDADINAIQTMFSSYFASIQISKVSSQPPVYNVAVVTLQGTVYNQNVAT